MNWASSMAWLLDPKGPPPRDLYAYVSRRVRVRVAKPKIKLPRGTKAKVKKVSLPKLKKELDRVFSLFIRQRDASPYSDLGRCSTCPHIAPWKDMDCGHYQPRQDLATRWEEKNCHLQCKSCNGFRGGEPEKMAAYIDAKYSVGTASDLRAQARQPFKLQRSWLEQKIAHYKGLIHE